MPRDRYVPGAALALPEIPFTGPEGAIKSFQKEENLKIDGVVRPNGETISHPSLAFKRIDSAGPNARERNYKIGKSEIGIQLDDEMRNWSDEVIVNYLINDESLEDNLGEVEKFGKEFMKAISGKNISLPRVSPAGGIRGEGNANKDFYAYGTTK